MTTRHLISDLNLTFLCDINAYRLVYSRRKFITIFSCEYFCIYNDTKFTMWYFQRSITYFSCFLTKDCTKKSFFCRQFCLSLRRYFTNKDITGTYFRANANDTSFVQILQCIITNARYITTAGTYLAGAS